MVWMRDGVMIGTGERILPLGSRNVYFQFFDLQIHFSLIWTPYIWIFLTSMVGCVGLWENVWRDESPMESLEILEDVNFRVIIKDWGSSWQCLPFCWSWTGGWKSEDNRRRGHWFWNWRFSTGVSGTFQAELVFFFFGKKD